MKHKMVSGIENFGGMMNFYGLRIDVNHFIEDRLIRQGKLNNNQYEINGERILNTSLEKSGFFRRIISSIYCFFEALLI